MSETPRMMTEPPSSSSPSTTIAELDEDSLAQCTKYLNFRDISNMAMTCKFFKSVAYSDSVWHRLLSKQWPNQVLIGSSQSSTIREAYLARLTAVQQFKFEDPLVAEFTTHAKPFSHVLLQRNNIIFSQGSVIQRLKIDSFLSGKDSLVTLRDHKARITCMRLYPLNEANSLQSDMQKCESVLLTSSSDHSIRLWGKDSCQRSFKGHHCPVSTLSDKLLGDGTSKVFASGGEDGTVRLWSLISSGKGGKRPLKATLYGHESPVKLISVAWHRPSLLVTAAYDSKIRVWDSTASSAARSSSCVGMTSVSGPPVSMRCYDSLLYVGDATSVVAIDLRTMKKAFTAANCRSELYCFDLLPSKSLVCTGTDNRALIWDIRKSQEQLKPEPVAELNENAGPVKLIHMDSYKIVTGCGYYSKIHVWDTETSARTNSLSCCYLDRPYPSLCSCTCMAVDGSRIVTASSCEDGHIRCTDFTNASCYTDSTDASCSISSRDYQLDSKFWKMNPDSDAESDYAEFDYNHLQE